MIQSFTSGRIARFGSGATILRSETAIDDDTLRTVAPSIFAEGKHSSRSERYAYIPTSDVLAGLRKEGFAPFEVRQGGSRDDEKRGFTKHLLRLRHESAKGDVENLREIVLLNSHDGTSSYQLMSGIFRIICNNGLITAGEGQLLRIAHKGDVVNKVIEGAYTIIDNSQYVAAAIEDLRSVTLSVDEQKVFAEAALQLRYDDGKAPELTQALEATRPRRTADVGNDLWKTFNRTQENLIRGGLGYVHTSERGERSYRHTRPVNSIDGNVTLNRALWTLAEGMKALKAA